MNNDKIICLINPFIMSQKINVYKNGENNFVDTDMENIGKLATELCYTHKIYNVVIKTLSAPVEFAEVIKDNISEEETMKYSTNKINIEVF